MRLEKLPYAEFILLCNVSNMDHQHGQRILHPIVNKILQLYDFNSQLGYHLSLDSALPHMIINSGFLKFEADYRPKLNSRSEALLCILAGQTVEQMGDAKKDWYFGHAGISTGENACRTLAAFSMMRTDAGGGYLTASGIEAALRALSPDFDPFPHFKFDEFE